MIGTARITSKGQITIPARVRAALDLKCGDELLFIVDGDEAHVLPIRHRFTVDELFGSLKSDIPYQGKEAQREAIGRYLGEKDRRIVREALERETGEPSDWEPNDWTS